MTIEVSPFSKCGLSLPPETAIPNPRFESFENKQQNSIPSEGILIERKKSSTNLL